MTDPITEAVKAGWAAILASNDPIKVLAGLSAAARVAHNAAIEAARKALRPYNPIMPAGAASVPRAMTPAEQDRALAALKIGDPT